MGEFDAEVNDSIGKLADAMLNAAEQSEAGGLTAEKRDFINRLMQSVHNSPAAGESVFHLVNSGKSRLNSYASSVVNGIFDAAANGKLDISTCSSARFANALFNASSLGAMNATDRGGNVIKEMVKHESSSEAWKRKNSNHIISRNNAAGKPRAITMFDVELNNQQAAIIEKLHEYNSTVVVNKNKVSMNDLSALTAKTGCEFAMFTRGSQRLIIRGNSYSVNVDVDKALELAHNGYKWSGHTHPGDSYFCLTASDEDYKILRAFGQTQSVTYNSVGKYMVYELED